MVEIVHLEVADEVLGLLAQPVLLVLLPPQLLLLAQTFFGLGGLGDKLVAVVAELCGSLTEVDVVVVDKIGLGLESRLAGMGHGLGEYLVEGLVLEAESVGPQGVVDILRHGEREVVALVVFHVVEDHLLPLLHDELGQEPLHLFRLL